MNIDAQIPITAEEDDNLDHVGHIILAHTLLSHKKNENNAETAVKVEDGGNSDTGNSRNNSDVRELNYQTDTA